MFITRGQPSNWRDCRRGRQDAGAVCESGYTSCGPTLAGEKLQALFRRIPIIAKPCGYGCAKRDCPTNSGKANRIGSRSRRRRCLARSCGWTDRIMTGWKGKARSSS